MTTTSALPDAPTGRATRRFGLPVSLDLAGHHCLVLGDGPLATEKAEQLADAGGTVTVRADFRPGDLEGFRLVIVTGETPATIDVLAVRAEATQRGVLMNALDDVPNCDFGFASLVRRGPVRIAISSGGRAPALARALRLRLEAELPEAVGGLAEAIGRVKDDTPRTVPFAEWAARWSRALEDLDALLALVADGDAARAEDRIRAEVSS